MYTTTAMKNAISASMAFFVTSPPHVGPTNEAETSFGFALVPVACARRMARRLITLLEIWFRSLAG